MAAALKFESRIVDVRAAGLSVVQRQKHGNQMLAAVFKQAESMNAVEVTVEDPAAGFQVPHRPLLLSVCSPLNVILDVTPSHNVQDGCIQRLSE